MKRDEISLKEAFKSLKLIYHFLIYFATSNKKHFVVVLLIKAMFYKQKNT